MTNSRKIYLDAQQFGSLRAYSPAKFAIDIGSSSLKLVCLSPEKSRHSKDFITALADCFDANGCINELGKNRLFKALDEAFAYKKSILKTWPKSLQQGNIRYLDSRNNIGKYSVKIAATAAFRKATNAGEICEEIKARYGYACAILSQEQEAQITIKAAKTYAKEPIEVLLDIGGASTEISDFRCGRSWFFDLGLISMTQRFGADFHQLYEASRAEFVSLKEAALAHSASKSLIYALSAPAGIGNAQIDEYSYAGQKINKQQLRDLAAFIDECTPERAYWLFDSNYADLQGAAGDASSAAAGEISRKSLRAGAIKAACAILCAMPYEEYCINPYALKDGLLLE